MTAMPGRLTPEALADTIANLLAEHTDLANVSPVDDDMRAYDVGGVFFDVTTKRGNTFTVMVRPE